MSTIEKRKYLIPITPHKRVLSMDCLTMYVPEEVMLTKALAFINTPKDLMTLGEEMFDLMVKDSKVALDVDGANAVFAYEGYMLEAYGYAEKVKRIADILKPILADVVAPEYLSVEPYLVKLSGSTLMVGWE